MALSHAILSALMNQPCSGYDLAKQFDVSVGYFWTASHQQIYRELNKLEEKALLTSTAIVQEGRPDKKLYEVTVAGQEALKDWMAQPASLPPIKDDLLVKLFSGYLIPPDQIKAVLEKARDEHQAMLEIYRQIESDFFSNPEEMTLSARFQYLTLRNGIHFEQGWLNWYDEAIATLESLPSNSQTPHKPVEG